MKFLQFLAPNLLNLLAFSAWEDREMKICAAAQKQPQKAPGTYVYIKKEEIFPTTISGSFF